MKIKIRRGMWESNSSTSHTLTIMMKDDYERWRSTNDLYLYNGEYNYYYNDDKPIKGLLYTKEEVIDFVKKNRFFDEEEMKSYEDEIDMYFSYNGFISYDFYFNDDNLSDEFEEEFTTSSGETIIVFGGTIYD